MKKLPIGISTFSEIITSDYNRLTMTRTEDWYNGYNFMGEKNFNPYDILPVIDNACQF